MLPNGTHRFGDAFIRIDFDKAMHRFQVVDQLDPSQ